MAETNGGAQQNSVVAPFLDFLNEYKTLLAAMVAIGTTAAISSLLTALGPPWPNRPAVATLTGVASMVLLAWSFLTWRRKADASYVGRMRLAVGLTAGFALVYLTLWASLLYETRGGSVIGGFSIRPEVLEVMKKDGITVEQTLAAAEFDPDRVWTHGSVAVSQVAFLATWIGFFCGVSTVLTTLLLALEAQKANQGTIAWGEGPKT